MSGSHLQSQVNRVWQPLVFFKSGPMRLISQFTRSCGGTGCKNHVKFVNSLWLFLKSFNLSIVSQLVLLTLSFITGSPDIEYD